MDFADLDRRVTFQRATTAPNAFNEPVETWADLVTVAAARKDVSDRERLAAAEVQSSLSARFTVRWMPVLATLTAKDRALSEGRTCEIVAIKELGRREGLEITVAVRDD